MIYDYLTGQFISNYTPFSANEIGWYSFDFSPFDTITNWFFYDGANYFYYEENRGIIDFSNNQFLTDNSFPPIDDLLPASAIPGGGTIGTGNFIADQSIGLVNGILAGGDPSFALGNQSIVNNGGLQNLPLGGFGSIF